MIPSPDNQSFWINYDVDLNSWRYDVYVPVGYDGTKPYGVVVYVSSNNTGAVLSSAATDKNLIWIAPRNVGNSADTGNRFGASLLALYRAKELFNIDPRRVYTSGLSGGARVASALAFFHPEVIHGTAPSSGLCIPRLDEVTPDYIPQTGTDTGDPYFDYSSGYFDLNYYYDISEVAAYDAYAQSNQLRSYLLTRYDDHREDWIVEAFHCAYELQGDTAFLYDGPGGHQDASDAEMEEAIDYLDRNDTFPVNANVTAGTSGFSNILNISQAGAAATGTTSGNGANAVTTFTLTPTLNAVAAVKSGSSFYWDNANGSTVRWLWEVKNAAPSNQKTCFGLWFTGETWGGGAPMSVTSGTNPGLLVTIYQTVSGGAPLNRMVISARPDSGGETVFYDGYFSFVPAFSTSYTSLTGTQAGYLPSAGGGSPVEMRLDLNKRRWQLTFNGIALNGATNSIANGTQISRDNRRMVFGYWDSALGTAFWKHGLFSSWNNTWSPFAKSILTAATGAASLTGSIPAAMDLSYVIASDPNLPAPLPAGPETITATGTNGAVRLSWSASPGATSYTVKRSAISGSGYSTLSSTTSLNYDDTAVANGNTYYYVVTAQTAFGESVTGPEARATPDPNSLIANLRFDENAGTIASDSTGHGWNGALFNGSGWSEGRINNALSLTGANSQYVTLPTGLLQGVTECTISAWVKMTTLTTWMRVFDFGIGTSSCMYLTPKGGSSKVHFGIITPATGAEQAVESSSAFPTGVWTHLAVTFSGSTATLYLNGAVAGTNTAMTANPASLGLTNLNYIGKSQFNDPYFDGLVDHFQIYGRALSATEVGALAATPAAPGGVIATGSAGAATIRWNAVNGATGYNVMRSTTIGTGYTLVATSVSGTSYVDSGLSNLKTYYYVVTAQSGVAESAYSAEASATTYGAPVITSPLSASGTKNSAFNYQITATSSPASFGVTGLPPGLNVNASTGLISGTPSGSGAFNVTISASNMIGTGSASVGLTVVSDQFAAPVGVVASPRNGSVTLTWLAVPTAVSYNIRRSTSSGSGYTLVATGVTGTSFTDTGVSNGTTYYYVITAVNGSGESAFSVQASATPLTFPAVPTGLAAIAGNTQVVLTWPAASDATGYNVKRATVSGGPYLLVASPTTPIFADIGLSNNTNYYYIVSSQNSQASSADSAEVAAVPHLPGTIAKLDNATNLNQAGSWAGGIVPSAGDSARWNGLVGANAVVLGSDMSLNAIAVGSTGGAVVVGGSNTLTLGTGGVDLSGATQNLAIFSGLTLGPGNQVWNAASTRTLTLTSGTFKRSAGSTLNLQGAGTVTSTMTGFSTNTIGILGPWATIGTGTNARYATFLGSTIGGFAGATFSADFGWASSNDNTFNYDVAGATASSLSSNRVANTVRYTGSATTQYLGSSNTTSITLNGLINSGTGTLTFGEPGAGSYGRVAIGTNNNNELDLVAANAGITIGLAIINAGSSAGSVVISGSNTVILSNGGSSYSGGTILNLGILSVGNGAALGTGTLTLSGGTLQNNNIAITQNNPITASGFTTTKLRGAATAGGRNYTLGGNIVGSGNLDLAGTFNNARLNLGGNNSGYVGTATISGVNVGFTNLNGGSANAAWVVNSGLHLNAGAGTYQLGSLSGNGNIGTIQNGAAILSVGGANTSPTAFTGSITNVSTTGNIGGAGTVALTKVGAGTLTLAGASSYTDPTTINSGTLMLNGALTGNSPVTVNNGGTLAGSGTSSGSLTVVGGGVLAPGNAAGAGSLTVSGGVSFGNGSLLNMQLGAASSSSKLALGGALTASGTTTINLTALPGFGPGTYPVITGTAMIGTANFAIGARPSGYSFSLTADSGTLSVVVGNLPAAPTGLTATAANGAVLLRWLPSSGADSYILKRSLSSGAGYTAVSLGITGTTSTDATVSNGTTYYYVLSAVNSGGESPNSSQVSATPDGIPPLISVPADITATATGANGAVVIFSTSAFDAISGPCATTNAPASGSLFPIGTTTVTSTAIDGCGNIGSKSFLITVQTPPISAEEKLRASALSLSGSAGTLTLKSAIAGHTYQLQFCDDLNSGIWQNDGPPQIGNATDLQFAVPLDAVKPRRFYRLEIRR